MTDVDAQEAISEDPANLDAATEPPPDLRAAEAPEHQDPPVVSAPPRPRSFAGRLGRFASRNWVPLAVLVVLVLLAGYLLSGFVFSHEGDVVGAFRLEATDGSILDPAEHRDEVIVLDVITSSCSICKAMKPELRAFDTAYGDRLQLWSISSGWFDSNKVMQNYAEEYDVTWKIAAGDMAFINEFNREGTTPKLIVIDKGGEIVYVARGYHTTEMIAEIVDPLLA